MEGNRPLLRFDRVTKCYAGRAVLRNISLSVRRGEAVAVVGPNGSGKSTLMRQATGLVAIDGGRIERPGHPGPPRIGYAPDLLPPPKFASTDLGETERPRSSRRRIVCTASNKVLEQLRAADGVERADLAEGRGSYLLRAEAADRFLLAALMAGASIESVTADV